MFQTFKNAFKIPDLRNKILFTLFIILLYRIGVAVPVPRRISLHQRIHYHSAACHRHPCA